MENFILTFFLDEPTSGLDSSTAKEIMFFLRKIANRGINVIAIVHQPRYEILNLCDQLLLLAKGGRTVYMGQVKVQNWAGFLGCPHPARPRPSRSCPSPENKIS